jgi:hypothetical protein
MPTSPSRPTSRSSVPGSTSALPRRRHDRRCADVGTTPIVPTSRLFRPRVSIACAVRNRPRSGRNYPSPSRRSSGGATTRSAEDLGSRADVDPRARVRGCPPAYGLSRGLRLPVRPSALPMPLEGFTSAVRSDRARPRDCSDLTSRKALPRKGIRDQVGTIPRSEQSAIWGARSCPPETGGLRRCATDAGRRGQRHSD